MTIDSTALLDPTAQIGANVKIGAYSIIKKGVSIGERTVIGSHVVIEEGTRIGSDCKFFSFCSIGAIPQDLKFNGEESSLIIGDRNTFREFITVNRATGLGGGVTKIGDDNFFMAYIHIAHDCKLGNHIIMANAATLGGHITIDDHAIIGGLVGIHQFVRIGTHSIVGGCSAVSQDVPPYTSAVGNRAKLRGLNLTGLKRNDFKPETIADLKSAYKILFRQHNKLQDSIEMIEKKYSGPEIDNLIKFINTADKNRGICRG